MQVDFVGLCNNTDLCHWLCIYCLFCVLSHVNMVLAKVTTSGLSTTPSFHASLCFKYTPSKLPVKGCLSFKATQKEVYGEKEEKKKKNQTNEATMLCSEMQIFCFNIHLQTGCCSKIFGTGTVSIVYKVVKLLVSHK